MAGSFCIDFYFVKVFYLNNRIFHGIIHVIVLSIIFSCSVQASTPLKDLKVNKYRPHPTTFDRALLKNKIPRIMVNGNHFENEFGEHVILRGMAMQDPDSFVSKYHWEPRDYFENFKESYFLKMVEWGANIIRVPIHPHALRASGVHNYVKLLDQIVLWADKYSVYLIFDWHSMGDIRMNKYQDIKYITTPQETISFWRFIGYRYQKVPNVAFYELFNEPTTLGRKAEMEDWLVWKSFFEQIIDQIRVFDQEVIPLVSGLDWSMDLTYASLKPIERDKIAYAFHPFPQKLSPPYKEDLGYKFSFLAKKYPLFATEFGYASSNYPEAEPPYIADDDYGELLIDYLEGEGISWTVWNFSPRWRPALLESWDYTPTPQGVFFKAALESSKQMKSDKR